MLKLKDIHKRIGEQSQCCFIKFYNSKKLKDMGYKYSVPTSWLKLSHFKWKWERNVLKTTASSTRRMQFIRWSSISLRGCSL